MYSQRSKILMRPGSSRSAHESRQPAARRACSAMLTRTPAAPHRHLGLPQMPIRSGELGRLVGRAGEVDLLASLLDGVVNAGAALVIRGEPGVGKSRLLAEG